MVRNPGKFGKAKRGGGHKFSRDLSRLNSDGEPDKTSSSESESSEEEEVKAPKKFGQLPSAEDDQFGSSNNNGLRANLNSTLSTLALEAPEDLPAVSNSRLGAAGAAQIAQARKDRKAASAKPQQKVKNSDDSGESEEENDNRKIGKMVKASDLNVPRELSRREKEAMDKKAAAERYAKLHAAGKTDEARSDLKRLAEIKMARAAAAAQRLAETQAKEISSKAALEKSGKKVPLKR